MNVEMADDTALWKYMAVRKLKGILAGGLYFRRADCYSDKLEGNLPERNISADEYCRQMAELQGLDANTAEAKHQNYLSNNPEGLLKLLEAWRKLCYVVCFTDNPSESPRMWREYTENGVGVAIKTTLGRLKSSLSWPRSVGPFPPEIRKVTYIDRAEWFEPKSGPFQLLSHKDMSTTDKEGFEWEEEVRIVAVHPETPGGDAVNILEGKPDLAGHAEVLDKFRATVKEGFDYCQVDPVILIESLLLYPGADEKFENDIKSLVADNGLHPSIVRKSELQP